MRVAPLSEFPDFIHTVSVWAFGHWYANSGIKFSAVEADYRRRSDFSQLPVTWVAVEDAKPVGMISMKEYDLLSHKHVSPWLSALYVIPEYRRRGYGEQLINTVIAYAREKGFESLTLFTDNRKGDYLVRYYELRGWTTIDKTLDQNGQPTNVMSFPLKDDIV